MKNKWKMKRMQFLGLVLLVLCLSGPWSARKAYAFVPPAAEEEKEDKDSYIIPPAPPLPQDEKDTEIEVRYPNKLTPYTPQGSKNEDKDKTNTNKGKPSPISKARGHVVENVDNANNPYPIHHGDKEMPSENPYAADARQFITFMTKNGKVFHLVINHDEKDENVLLLTEVSEDDLLNMVAKPKVEKAPSEAPKPAPVKKEKPKNNTGEYIVLAIVLLGVLGLAYYFKVFKKKEEEELADLEDPDEESYYGEISESEGNDYNLEELDEYEEMDETTNHEDM